ncbi:hypothetical protein [Hymenobacter glacialis]|uniref:Uncharacterized protein n=1 Tax=Hymenobacter glacialis TaxID=1908236 RepID=A0A1G1T133_9BACT|nr:hypothetical protein [Hymenobacter glacialis]OGX84591.1 hypothetical protein BEN48_02290 [Hymenobacter glacialis]
MAISLNPQAVTYAKRLIRDGNTKGHKSPWAAHVPCTADEDIFLESHEIEEYGNWYLGLDMSKRENSPERYHFPYGDFRAVHHNGLLAARESAAQQGYSDIENAAIKLLKFMTERAC